MLPPPHTHTMSCTMPEARGAVLQRRQATAALVRRPLAASTRRGRPSTQQRCRRTASECSRRNGGRGTQVAWCAVRRRAGRGCPIRQRLGRQTCARHGRPATHLPQTRRSGRRQLHDGYVRLGNGSGTSLGVGRSHTSRPIAALKHCHPRFTGAACSCARRLRAVQRALGPWLGSVPTSRPRRKRLHR